jgi:hypothetical protein
MAVRRESTRAAFLLGALGLGCVLAGCGQGCGKTDAPAGPAAELTGLAAVPANAEVVIGADIKKLAGSPIIDRAVDQLLARNPVLSERWQLLRDGCKIDVEKQVKRVMLALGPHVGPEPGTGPVLMVVVGALPEADLKDCVTKLVGSGGGTVTGKPLSGRTLYVAKDNNQTTYFAYGRPDTVVLGANEAYVSEALGTGKKASDNPELARWLRLTKESAPLWGAGRLDARLRDGLAKLLDGKITAGPVAFAFTADFQNGADLQLSAVMASPADAKALESYAKTELPLYTAAAQLKSLGPVVGKLTVIAENETVRFHIPLSVDDLNLLLSALDGGGGAAQDSAPPKTGSGSGTQ